MIWEMFCVASGAPGQRGSCKGFEIIARGGQKSYAAATGAVIGHPREGEESGHFHKETGRGHVGQVGD